MDLADLGNRLETDLRGPIALSSAVFLVGILTGYVLPAVLDSPGDAADGAQLEFELTFFSIVTNNMFVYVMMILGGVFFGAITAVLLFNTGLLIGVALFGTVDQHGIVAFIILIAPHGILELPAYLVGAGLGFEIARRLVQYLREKRDKPFTRPELESYAALAVSGGVLIVLSAFIEAEITLELFNMYL